ncbi:MAG: hypothetical protein IKV68_04680 [Oscillospiraceae bacterium]|nr:hypothetical protein [Oscillospiraceae bacterium]
MKKQKGFMIYLDWWEAMSLLTGDELHSFLQAMVDFTRSGAETKFEDRLLQGHWALIQSRMIRDRERYEKTCKMRQAAANKRWGKAAVLPDDRSKSGIDVLCDWGEV